MISPDTLIINHNNLQKTLYYEFKIKSRLYYFPHRLTVFADCDKIYQIFFERELKPWILTKPI